MFHSFHSETDERRCRPPSRSTDYLKIRLRRMVQSVMKQELDTGSSCPIIDVLTNKDQNAFYKGARLALLVMCFTMFTHQMYERISHYFTYPISVDAFITSSKFQQFPEMTICYQETAALFQLMDEYNMICYHLPMYSILSFSHGLSVEEVWKKINGTSATISAQEIMGAHAVPLNNTEEPLSSGTCTTFRSNDPNRTNKKGEHYFKVTFRMFSHRCSKTTYTKVYIHDSGDHPTFRQMFTIPTGLIGEIAMTQRKFVFVNRPGNLCISSKDLRACMDDCLAKYIYKIGATNCRFPFYPPMMNNISSNCVTPYALYSWIKLHNYMVGQTGTACDCPRKCEHSTFGERLITFDNMGNTSTFVLRYDSPILTIIKERLCYGLIELFCDIGGNSGLYIGISLLSVFQLGHVLPCLKKKRSNFSIADPLYKKVLKTYVTWKKQDNCKKDLLTKSMSFCKMGILFKRVVFLICVCLLITLSVNRLSFFFEYPMKTNLHVTFNMSLKAPTVVLCPGDENVMKLQQEVAKLRNISNPCNVNVWELFELPGVNCTHVWPKQNMESRQYLKGVKSISVYPSIPLYDGKCVDLNDGSVTIPANKASLFCDEVPHQCGTHHLKAYIRSSTGNLDYHRYQFFTHDCKEQMTFIYKEINIEETGVPCISSEENEQCLTNCLNRKLFLQINCRLPYMPEADLPLCHSSSSAHQAHIAFRDLFLIYGNTNDCNCLPKCRTRFLEIRNFVEQHDLGYLCFTFGPGHNVVESYEIVRAYTVVKLLCDIGGLLGSTLGLCLFEITETAISFVANQLHKWKKPKKVSVGKV